MKKKSLFMIPIIGVILVLAVTRITGNKEEVEEDKVTMVEITCPERATIELYTDLIGTVKPENSARIYPEASGTVTEVFVKAGDSVSNGQPLCIIDTKQVENAKNSMDNAEIVNREASVQLGRMQVLYQSGAISQQEYEGYANAAEKAAISYKQAKEEYERQYSYSHISAPIGGRVESWGIEVLDRITTGSLIGVISGEGNKIISSGLTDNLRRELQISDQVFIEKANQIYTGTIMELSEMADETTGLYEMKIQAGEIQELSTGSVVKISVCSNRADEALTIPVDAVYYENSIPCVYTYENGLIHKLFITTGILMLSGCRSWKD
ncbi:efflux RND transporter periplasmic adaptor subunit [Lachnoclostridium pacaense]|uniref:efflux RND transporter periplasmic adaptor subunit n=1 Tax=Enterocloster hominis (ex Hitch et al. 2024) TaxID=1917870 RepID=UPI001D12630C|nr:efflux RND transporter periplasmic adaptor subunit [Lachnoclostridium pacaense]MCC2817182.1 efflux RND transporter periplasmic adaptor subunit [Lachnoclostridium pacaense]